MHFDTASLPQRAAKSIEKTAPNENLVVGQPFEPHGRFRAAWIPVSLLRYPKLSEGAKLLYGRLTLYKGKPGGECNPRRETLAAEMGSSLATIGRQLDELVKEEFIRRIRRGPNRPASCEFLFHPALTESLRDGSEVSYQDSAKLSHQEPADSAKVSYHKPALMAQFRVADISKVSHLDSSKVSRPYKDEEIQSEEIQLRDSSSSSEKRSGLTEQDRATNESTTTTRFLISGNPDPDPELCIEPEVLEVWPTEADFRDGRAALRYLKACFQIGSPNAWEAAEKLELPDVVITRKILAHFHNAGDFSDYVCYKSVNRPSAIRTYGFFESDARQMWPGLRESAKESQAVRQAEHDEAVQSQRAAKEHEEERERQKAASYAAFEETERACRDKGWKRLESLACPGCAGYGRNPVSEEYCTCSAGREAKRCPKCGDHACTMSTDYADGNSVARFAWCDCSVALTRREAEPSYVDEKNETEQKFWQEIQSKRAARRTA